MRHVAILMCLSILAATLAGCTSGDTQSTNECWKEIYETNDSPPGGVIDSNTTYHYDEGRNLIVEEELLWNGGIGDRTTYTYDSNSNLVEIYRTWDGEFEKISYTYDSDGNEITKSEQNSYTWDDDYTRVKTYSTTGQLLTSETDELSDGSIDSRTTYIYDEDNDLLIERHEDQNADGHPEEIEIYEYNDQQLLIRGQTYDASDNSLIAYEELTYNSNGDTLSHKIDWDYDGRYDVTFTYTYDESFRLVSLTTFFDDEIELFRGTYITSYSYIDNTDDMSVSVMNSYDGAGDLDRVWTTYYGCVN